MITLVVATRNAHKVAEIRSILGERFRCDTLSDYPGAPEVAEDALSFAGNAAKKSVELVKWLTQQPSGGTGGPDNEPSDLYVLADDSGLEVDVLGGAPGVHSARFAALDAHQDGNARDEDNNAKLLRLLGELPSEKRTARFRCVLALTPILTAYPKWGSPVCLADEHELTTELFEGTCEGHIAFKPSGQGGFGYDPLFIPSGYEQSFAELGENIKNRLSHRARALECLRKRLTA